MLMQRHGPMVYGVCQRVLHDPHDAADAFQATFLVLLRKIASITKQDSLAGWLFGVAHRTAQEAKRRAARRRTHERQVATMSRTDPEGCDTEVAWGELCHLLDEELSRLPAKYRMPLVLHYLEGNTMHATAQQLGWAVGTVSGRLARARALLHRRLSRRGVMLSVGLLGTVLAQKAAVASVPPALVRTTLRGALQFSAGTLAAGAFSGPVAQLADAVLTRLFLTKWAVTAAVLLAVVSVAGTRAGLVMRTHNGEQLVAMTRLPEPAAVARPPQRFAHDDEMTAVALAPDGRTLASVSGDRTLHVWDLVTGQERHRLAPAGQKVFALAFGPDSQPRAATCGDDAAVRLWNLTTGEELGRLPGFRNGVLAGTFSSQSELLVIAGPRQQTIPVWNWAAGTPPRHLGGYFRGVFSLAFSADDTLLAFACADHRITVREVATYRQRRALQGHQDRVTSLVFFPDGKTLVSGSADRTIRLWQVETAKEIHQLRGHEGGITCLALSATGETLVSGSTDGTLRIWDVTTGKELRRIAAHAGGVAAVAWSRDGKTLASGGKDRMVRLWQATPVR